MDRIDLAEDRDKCHAVFEHGNGHSDFIERGELQGSQGLFHGIR